jgi:WD40 repeat protein
LSSHDDPRDLAYLVESPAAPAVILGLSPDGQWMASGDHHGRITLWNLRDADAGYSNLRRPWISQPVDILEFSPDGLWLFCASNDTNKYLYLAKLWKLGEHDDAKDGIRLNANTYPFESAQFAPGGRWFITGHNNGPRIWDLHSVDPSKNPVVVGSNDIQRQTIFNVKRYSTSGDRAGGRHVAIARRWQHSGEAAKQ